MPGLTPSSSVTRALAGEATKMCSPQLGKMDRVLLTHDDDFLDDRRFPPHRNPGLIVFRPGAQGDNDHELRWAIARMVLLVGQLREVWRGAKIVFSDRDHLSVIARNSRTGAIETECYRHTKRELLVWREDSNEASTVS